MKRILVLIILSSSFFTHQCHAQDQHLIDSLNKELKKCEDWKIEHKGVKDPMHDTTAIYIISELSNDYAGSNNDKAIEYANQCMALSEKIGFKKGIGKAYNCFGNIYEFKGDYIHAIEMHKKALKVREEIKDKSGIADSYINLGNVYSEQGLFTEALKSFFISLKTYEEYADKTGLACCYHNIGSIYQNMGNSDEALKSYFAALKINKETGNKQWQAYNLVNIGLTYNSQGHREEALNSYLEALKILKDISDKYGIIIDLNDIAQVYFFQNNFTESLKYAFEALKLTDVANDKRGLVLSSINIGANLTKQNKFNDATEYLKKALSVSKEIGNLDLIKQSYNYLEILDSSQGNFNKALENYKFFISYRDSLVNTENTKKTVALQMNYEFDKKQDSLNSVQEKKDAVAKVELNKQKQQKYGLFIGLGVMLAFALVFLRQRNKIGKEKKNVEKEKERSEELLLNILPSEVAAELKEKGSADAKMFDDVTVMFTDFKGFTTIAEKLSAKELVGEINYCFSAFDNIIHKYGIEKIKTIGDSYMAAGGLPVANKTHAKDVVNAALEINKFMEEHKQQRLKEGKEIFEIRIGIHTGPVVAGIVGIKKFAYDIWGDTVNLASRMESSGEAGKVNISGSTYELIKNDFNCTYRGKIQAKNKGEVDMYFVIK
jgi:adenylate cyclase